MFSKFKDSFNAGLAQAGVDAARRNQSPRNSTSTDRPLPAPVAVPAKITASDDKPENRSFEENLDADSEAEEEGAATIKADPPAATTGSARTSVDDASRAPAAPADLRKKLRKLDKYEEKYPELLTAYRALQQQQQQTIQFEQVLRDLTPATTVADVEAFQQWAGNFALKTEMSMEELRRVSAALQEAKEAQSKAEEKCKALEESGKASVIDTTSAERVKELEAHLEQEKEAEAKLKARVDVLEAAQARHAQEREEAVSAVTEELTATRKQVVELKVAHAHALRQQASVTQASTMPATSTVDEVEAETPAQDGPLSKSQKKRRNKKKGGPGAADDNTKVTETISHPPQQPAATTSESATQLREARDALQAQLDRLQAEADAYTAEKATYERRLKQQRDEKEEIAGLREMVAGVGSELVEAREEVKALKSQVATAQDSAQLDALTKLVTDQEVSIVNLKAELARSAKELEMAERLSSERFRELTTSKELASKRAAELTDVKQQLASFTTDKQALEARIKVAETRVKVLERGERDRKDEIASLKTSLSSRERELKVIQTAFKEEEARRKAEEARGVTLKAELVKISGLRDAMAGARDDAVKQAAQARQELAQGNTKVQEMQALRNKMAQERDAAQEALAQREQLFEDAGQQANSLREQTADMQHRMREATERLEACEEELAESQRALGERAREASTMRRLLSEMEASQATRLREMRERMEKASAERDKAEDEAAFLGKKRTREVEALKEQLADAERARRRALTEKDDLAAQVATLERSKQAAEQLAQERDADLQELKRSSKSLSTAVQDSERQLSLLEAERQTYQRQGKEIQTRLEALQSQLQAKEDLVGRLNRERGDWADAMSPLARRGNNSRDHSFSMPPMSPGSPMRSPSLHSVQLSDRPKEKAEVDREYIKNVLFQFLEHKERRGMLVPVISRLLLLTKQQESMFVSGFR